MIPSVDLGGKQGLSILQGYMNQKAEKNKLFDPLSANPTKCSNNSSITILWGLRLKGWLHCLSCLSDSCSVVPDQIFKGDVNVLFELINHFLPKLTFKVLNLIKELFLVVLRTPRMAVELGLLNFWKQVHDQTRIIWIGGSIENYHVTLFFDIGFSRDEIDGKRCFLYVIFKTGIVTILWIIWKKFA